jgi:polyhydroxyalkanoate synthesis regulator phasin
LEREEELLDQQLEAGTITPEEHRKALKELRDEARDIQNEEDRRQDFDARWEL